MPNFDPYIILPLILILLHGWLSGMWMRDKKPLMGILALGTSIIYIIVMIRRIEYLGC